MTAGVIALEEWVEDVQKKAFPQVGELFGQLLLTNSFFLLDSCQTPLLISQPTTSSFNDGGGDPSGCLWSTCH